MPEAELTPRMEEIVVLVAEGMSYREAADELDLSEHTVRTYVQQIAMRVGDGKMQPRKAIFWYYHNVLMGDVA